MFDGSDLLSNSFLIYSNVWWRILSWILEPSVSCQDKILARGRVNIDTAKSYLPTPSLDFRSDANFKI